MSNLNTEAYLRAKGYLGSSSIEHDFPCRECGYNLRGLKYDGKCPECGTVIERGKPEYQHLMDAPESFIRKIRLGLGCLCLGMWMPIVVAIASDLFRTAGPWFVLAIIVVGQSSFIVGAWIITGRKPHESEMSRSPLHVATITRAAVILTLIMVVLTTLALAGPLPQFLRFPTKVLIYAQLVLLIWYLADYARWVHDDHLANRFDHIMILLGLVGIVDSIMYCFGSSIAMFGCIGAILRGGSVFWLLITVLQLFGTINQAVIDKARHDTSIFRDPAKKLK